MRNAERLNHVCRYAFFIILLSVSVLALKWYQFGRKSGNSLKGMY
jgi:hypothetical protein